MHDRAAELIDALGLVPHPEGGHFAEVYRSGVTVGTLDARSERAAVTTIYFLLAAGEFSCWHTVASDEIWHYYEGDTLELWTADARLERVTRHMLGAAAGNSRPVQVVAAGEWQAARSAGAYTLVGCTVAPGFEFADFEMLRQHPARADALRRRHPAVADLV